jgi:hypothetical protein
MVRSRGYARILGLAGALCAALILPAGTARAQEVLVSPTVSPLSGGLFRYKYSVTNNTSLPLSVVTINVFSLPDAVQNATAPTGFSIFFDPGLGLLDFVEDTENFAVGTTISGFEFDSAFAPNPSSFEAVALDANENPVTFVGSTLAPTAIPEPGTLVLGLGLVPGLLLAYRRRRS